MRRAEGIAQTAVTLAAAIFQIGVLGVVACAPARTPDVAVAIPNDADGGELTCEERLRAKALCTSAIRERCDSRAQECESGCGTGDLPKAGQAEGTTESSFVTDVDQTRCRENCGHMHQGCLQSAILNCPAKCD